MMKYLCQLMMTKKVVLNDFLKQPSEVFTVIFNVPAKSKAVNKSIKKIRINLIFSVEIFSGK